MKGQQGPRRRRLTYANVISTLALFLAVSGGTAFAASKLIKGSQIAKGTITAANIKKSTLTSKLFAKNQLKTGPRGATGPQGAQGAAGTAVAYGIVLTNGTTGNATFTENVGFPGAVRNPSAGLYCITAPSGYTGVPVFVTGETPGDIIYQSAPNNCNTGEYQLESFNLQSGNATDSGFNIMVP